MMENISLDWNVIKQQLLSMAVEYGPKLLFALVVLFIGLRIVKYIQKTVRRISAASHLEPGLQTFLANLAGWVMKAMLFIAVADMIGIKTTSFIAIIGAAGLAIGLALQGTLANFAGGVLVMIFKPYKIGDLIESQSVLGTVKEIQIFNTIITTAENKTVIMPNGAIMNNHITNVSTEGTLRVDLTIGIDYKSDITTAKNILMETLLTDSRVLKTPEPIVAVSSLADNSIILVVRPFCTLEDYWNVRFDTLENCKLALDKAGIGIPFPQRDIHIFNH